ncbi:MULTISPECIES: hypothetical protein [unclassified Mesorhizobium]|uniref:hypothetical protein n=1 Tax=unclassified Mesorhizobium TaxID=325217 RepID=UPI00112E4EA1|nr:MULTISPECIES: hypothetical protein [unclassified Mesorhizobium]TPJ51639.1 hypothetical protein FJ426_20620 [Mesorhizobium sp. B2-6-4]TPN42317.1 hypothetical protein FJ979_01900 [Mesorhizobium sp. B1-1-6]
MFDNLILKRKLRNSLIICFRCDGCMGTDHNFQWIGTVVGFEKTRFAGEAAQVRIIKRDTHGDWRDGSQGFELVTLGEKPQKLAPALYAVYR